jgi:hypothetical protein
MAAKTGTYTLIQSTTLGSNQSTVTFSSIPQTYTDLVLIMSARGTTSAPNTSVYFTTNISGSNYSVSWGVGDGISAGVGRYTNLGQGYLGYVSAGTTNSNSRGTLIANFLDYSNTTTFKSVLCRSGVAEAEVNNYINLIRGTSALTSITVGEGGGNSFVTGSTFRLYGIEAAK